MAKNNRSPVDNVRSNYSRANNLTSANFGAEQDLARANPVGKEKQKERDRAVVGSVVLALMGFLLTLIIMNYVSDFWVGRKADSLVAEVPTYFGYDDSGEARQWWQLDQDQNLVDGPYQSKEEVPEPTWHQEAKTEARQAADSYQIPWSWRLGISMFGCAAVWCAALMTVCKKALGSASYEPLLNDNVNDNHLMTEGEKDEHYVWIPDAGAIHNVRPTAIVSHAFFANDGLKKQEQAKFEAVEGAKGVDPVVVDDKVVTHMVDMVDTRQAKMILTDAKVGYKHFDRKVSTLADFVAKMPECALKRVIAADLLGQSVESPEKTALLLNTSKIRMPNGQKLSDYINEHWYQDPLDPQRPCGAYRVTTADTHVIVIAPTRSMKTQTYIMPFIDICRRMEEPPNLVISDMKGELLKNFYPALEHSGYDVRQFNFTNIQNTDIYNPLQIAAEYMANGMSDAASASMTRLAECFYPKVKGGDSFWNDAASGCYQMIVWLLVDIVLRRDIEIEMMRTSENPDLKITDAKARMLSDDNWSRLSLQGVYRLFRDMAGWSVPAPSRQMKAEIERIKSKQESYNLAYSQALSQAGDEAEKKQLEDKYLRVARKEAARRQVIEEKLKTEPDPLEPLWQGQESRDMLSLFAEAVSRFPKDKVREQMRSARASLTSMESSEKTIASIYGVATTQMRQFDDDNLARITSGRRSRNIDINSLSFPRRISLRFSEAWLQANGLKNISCIFDAYSKNVLSEQNCLGKEFHHEGFIDINGWANYDFEGICPDTPIYVRCRFAEHVTKQEVAAPVYFSFKKGYRTVAGGHNRVKTPYSHEYVAEGGTFREMVPKKDVKGPDVVLVEGQSTYQSRSYDARRAIAQYAEQTAKLEAKKNETSNIFEVDEEPGQIHRQKVEAIPQSRIAKTQIVYSERPKAIFFVVDLTKTQYLSILLIYLHQQFEANVTAAYGSKESQTPQTPTYFLVDEAGNLKTSANTGIPELGAKFSLGLGQQQYFTLILQTMQQLKELYPGENENISGNAMVQIYLGAKEPEDIDHIVKLSGKKHEVHVTSQTMPLRTGPTDFVQPSEVSRQMSVVDADVISGNMVRSMKEGQSIVFDSKAGGAPIFNKSECLMPPDYLLHPLRPGGTYTSSLPTNMPTSTQEKASEKSMTDFIEEFDRVMWICRRLPEAQNTYMSYMDMDELDFKKAQAKDPDTVAKDIVATAWLLVEQEKRDLEARGKKMRRYSVDYFKNDEYEEETQAAEAVIDNLMDQVVIDLGEDLTGTHRALLAKHLMCPDAAGKLQPKNSIDGNIERFLVAIFDDPAFQQAANFIAKKENESLVAFEVEGKEVLSKKAFENPAQDEFEDESYYQNDEHDGYEDQENSVQDSLSQKIDEAYQRWQITPEGYRWLCGSKRPQGRAKALLEQTFGYYCRQLGCPTLGDFSEEGSTGEQDDS